MFFIWASTASLISACSEQQITRAPDSIHRYTEVRLVDAQLAQDASVSALLTRGQEISVWDNQSKALINHWDSTDLFEPSYMLALSGNKQLLATAGKQQVTLFNIATGKLHANWSVAGFKENATIASLSLNQTGSAVLIGLTEGTIINANLSNDTLSMFHLHSGPVTNVSFAALGQQILSSSHDGKVLLWAASNGQIIKEFSREFRITSLAYDEKNRRLFYADIVDNNSIVDPTNSRELSTLNYLERYRYFRQAIFSERGNTLITSSSKQGLTRWDVKTGQELSTWNVNAFTPGTTVLSMALDSEGKLWTMSSDAALEEWTD